MTTRVAIYARVSTVNHGQDVSMQTRELRQFAEARGWSVAGEYIDAGVSGTKDSRPELNRLMGDAHKRRFDVVCVWRFASADGRPMRLPLARAFRRPALTRSVDASQIALLRAEGVSWCEIERRMGVSARTARRALAARGKNLSANAPASAAD
jgi:DNA invertase Pin-like site-specific DNA recombinase